MPAGLLVTVPIPPPAKVTVTLAVEFEVKLALTEALFCKVTAHEAVPLHAPLHPENVEPVEAVAVSVIGVPVANIAVHVDPQLMPTGVLMTDPDPPPASWTLNDGFDVKLAVTVLLVVSMTVHPAIPVQAPPHPEK